MRRPSVGTTDLLHLYKLHDKGLPIVFFDRDTEEMQTHKAIANNFNGAYRATQHFHESGFKRIAYVTIASHLSVTKERLAGHRASLSDNNIPFDENLVKYCKYAGVIYGETEAVVEGFTNSLMADLCHPPLSKIRQPAFEMGQT